MWMSVPAAFRGRLSFVVLALAGLLSPLGCADPVPSNQFAPPPPPEVKVAHPLEQAITIYQEETGQTESVGSAQVRSRVNGYVQQVNFAPGQEVNKDDVLYVIEKDEYEAAVDAAKAEVSTAEASIQTMEAKVGEAKVELNRSELEFQRVARLRDQNVVTQADYEVAEASRDSAKALLDSAEANVTAAKAELKRANARLTQANLDLAYTDVVAPISGHITKTDVKVGNLVDPGTMLTTIVNADEIYVNFSLSDRDAMRLQKAAMEEMKARGESPPKSDSRAPSYIHRKAFLRREVDKNFDFEGKLNYVDEKGVDPKTGTLAVRAIFPNSRHTIFPGLFVYIRVPVQTVDAALLIPEQLVARDQTGPYVLTVNKDNEIERKDITTGQSYPDYVVVKTGLEKEDQVIISGSQRLRPGMKVVPTLEPLPPANLEKAISPEDNEQTASSTEDDSTDATNATETTDKAAKDVESTPDSDAGSSSSNSSDESTPASSGKTPSR
ncbi:MAG: efflux transporter periplasmic adaptor subunit [Planctomyces sp.]|nr:efflux transporter periplasmic adaptor subunit [Planctomyces sp.]